MDSIPDPSGSGSDTESTTSLPSPSPQPHLRHSEKAIFPLAHPPPNPKPTQRLRLTPKLLLQIQHLCPNATRPLPVLEVWLPSLFAGRPCGDLPKLRGGDVYITQSEGYTSLSGDDHSRDLAADEEAAGSQEGGAVVGVIYRGHDQKPKSNSKSKTEEAQAEAEVHFPLGGRTWTASATASGGYRFHSRGGEHVLEWKRRGTGKRERPMSGSSSSTDAAPRGDGRFVLGIVDVRTRRGARVASLTKRGFEVGCWKRLPLEGLQECVVASSTEAGAGAELSEGQLRTAVYTMILTMGVWVASQEGWWLG